MLPSSGECSSSSYWTSCEAPSSAKAPDIFTTILLVMRGVFIGDIILTNICNTILVGEERLPSNKSLRKHRNFHAFSKVMHTADNHVQHKQPVWRTVRTLPRPPLQNIPIWLRTLIWRMKKTQVSTFYPSSKSSGKRVVWVKIWVRALISLPDLQVSRGHPSRSWVERIH